MTPSQLALAGAREDAERKAEALKEERARQEASMRDVSYGGQNFRVPESTAANNAFELEKAKRTAKGGMGAPPGLKLKPGEMWDDPSQTVKAVPGSDLFRNQSAKHAARAKGVSGIEQKTKTSVDAIDSFLLKPDNVKSQFGKGYSGLITSRFDPDARAKLEQVKKNIVGAGLDIIRSGGSIGQVTEREWDMIGKQVSALDQTMSEEMARKELENIRTMLLETERREKSSYEDEWGGSQYYKQPQQAPQGGIRKDANGVIYID